MPAYKWAIFAFSLLGFVWLPVGLQRWLWFLVIYFVGLNGFFLLQDHPFMPSENLAVFLLLSHGPWIAVLADLVMRGKLAKIFEDMPYRQLLLFEATRFMGLHYIGSGRDGDAPLEFAAEACLGECLSALCALILFVAAKNPGAGFRMGLLVWNTYGMAALISLQFKLFYSNPFISSPRYSREIFQYMTDYPQAWLTFFWMPLTFAGHLIIFYKILRERLAAFRPPQDFPTPTSV
jgi:hypothetical protein